jgi:ribosome recycling factor
MIREIVSEAKEKMANSEAALSADLAKHRTGRASPALIQHVKVKLDDKNIRELNQIASISVLDNRTLSVKPWDKSCVQAIMKGIQLADLGLNPSNTSESILVPLPQLTEERRKELVKLVKKIGSIISSTWAASRPATRIFLISSFVLG